ncbi:MAG: hypothetical protein QOD26_1690 [Betaproteobacteria bacterium]|nr:hypothetical protein [Betaproteobacteria bacterium]
MPKKRVSEPDLTAQQLRAVLSIAKLGSFVAAATELETSQSSLTRTIQALEKALGLPLFTRSAHKVVVTPAGEEFVAVAERMLGDLSIAVTNMADLAHQRRGRVVVSCLMSVAHGRLPAAIANYLARYPTIQIQVREGIQDAVEMDVRAGVADFGVASIDDVDESLVQHRLGKESFYAVLPDGHPLAERQQIPLEKLKRESLISLPVGSYSRRAIEGAAANAGFSLRYVASATQFATIVRLVEEGVGIALLPAPVGQAKGSKVVSRPITQPALFRSLGVLALRDRTLSPAAAGLVDAIQKVMRV